MKKYLFSFYRGDELLHAQQATLAEGAVLCARSSRSAAVIGQRCGSMDQDGVITWPDGQEDHSVAIYAKLVKLELKWRQAADDKSVFWDGELKSAVELEEPHIIRRLADDLAILIKEVRMKALSERRKADRKQMADILAEKMIAAGATAVVEPCDYVPNRMDVHIKAPGGAEVTVDFDGGSCQPDVYVVMWNIHGFDGKTFFDPTIGDVNPYHYGKASRVCYGFEALVRKLETDVRRFVDGLGYMDPGDQRILDMRERYRERGWSWPSEGKTA